MGRDAGATPNSLINSALVTYSNNLAAVVFICPSSQYEKRTLMNTNRSIRWLLLGILMFSLSAASFAEIAVGFSVRFGPPAIPVYAQPICPGPEIFWTSGYWAWSDDGGYYWVPGTWVIAPVGMLWTPGYWGWEGGFYRWHAGYWGPHVGFYGGINYGFGYTAESGSSEASGEGEISSTTAQS